MTAVPTQQIVDEVRTLSGLRRSPYFSDVEISEFVADAGTELADIFIASFEHHFQTPFDFTLAGQVGGNTVTLPDDFQKENILLLNPTLDAPERVPLLGSQEERAAVGPGVFVGGGRRAFIAGQTLEVLPPSMAAGSYRLLYTPQFSTLAFPRAPDFTVPVAAMTNIPIVPNGTPETGTIWTVTPSSFPWVQNGVTVFGGPGSPFILLNAQNSQAQNGVFVITGTPGPGTYNAQRMFNIASNPSAVMLPARGQTVLVTGGTIGAGYYVQTTDVPTLDTSPIVIAPPALPASLRPWQRYLKIHASLTVRRARQQPAADLDRELTMLKARAAKMAASRTEQPKQAPMTRGRAPWWNTGGSGWR